MMLAPERMLRVDILTLADGVEETSRLLLREGSFHIIDQRTHRLDALCGPVTADAALVEQCGKLRALADVLRQRIGAGEDDLPRTSLDQALARTPATLVEDARKVLDRIRGEVDGNVREREQEEASIAALDEISEEMHLLHDNGLSPAELGGMRHLFAAYGLVDRDAVARLASRMPGESFAWATRPLRGGETLLLLVGDREKREAWTAHLAEAGFRQHPIPERFSGSFEDGLDLVEAELWEHRDRLAELRRAFEKSRPGWTADLSFWLTALRVQGMLAECAARFGAVGRAVLVSGFVPVSRWPSLRAVLEKSLAGRHAAEARPADEAEGVRVPSRLKNWSFFRPFEMFVRTYGTPGYRDIDPTPFVGISFLAMFGMMFGDVGHGAMLAAIGAAIAFLPYRLFSSFRDLGRILLMAGCSGIVFGFLFGSVFGVEEDSVLRALWMRPSHPENLIRYMGCALGLGVGILSLGIILGIAQSLRQGNVKRALIGQWSASSLGFFWGLLGLFAVQMMGKQIPGSKWVIACALMAPLALIGVGQIALRGRGGHGDGEHEEELATLLFEPVEVVMNLFANSVSFLRVAAFGLAHAALTMATFVIRDMARSPGVDILTQPVEHLGIVALEGMIVTIQCLRLEYYEFFSKFFGGDGVPFAPMSADRE